MDSAKLKSWWASLGIGMSEASTAPDDADDLADMGTAFGLDASLCPASPTNETGRPVSGSPRAE